MMFFNVVYAVEEDISPVAEAGCNCQRRYTRADEESRNGVTRSVSAILSQVLALFTNQLTIVTAFFSLKFNVIDRSFCKQIRYFTAF